MSEPAFPHNEFWEDNSGNINPLHHLGLTKREWFAGMALQGLLAHASGEDPHKSPALAFVLADAMIAASKDEAP